MPLLIRQRASGRMRALYRADSAVLAWWGTRVECESAIARLERERTLRPRSAAAARGRLARFAATWQEVQPSDLLREGALRFLRVHELRAADALQLAAGVAAAEGQPTTLGFVCLDDRLAEAAEREGFPVAGMRAALPRAKAARVREHRTSKPKSSE